MAGNVPVATLAVDGSAARLDCEVKKVVTAPFTATDTLITGVPLVPMEKVDTAPPFAIRIRQFDKISFVIPKKKLVEFPALKINDLMYQIIPKYCCFGRAATAHETSGADFDSKRRCQLQSSCRKTRICKNSRGFAIAKKRRKQCIETQSTVVWDWDHKLTVCCYKT